MLFAASPNATMALPDMRSVRPDLASSFYVGDAAGRPGDHSDTDREFARAVGVRFHTETEFFKEIHKA